MPNATDERTPVTTVSIDADCSAEVREMSQRNLHVFEVAIDGEGVTEVLFQGLTRHEAEVKCREWVATEHHVRMGDHVE